MVAPLFALFFLPPQSVPAKTVKCLVTWWQNLSTRQSAAVLPSIPIRWRLFYTTLCDIKFTRYEKLTLSLHEVLHYPHTTASPATQKHIIHLRALMKLNVLSWQPITPSISRRTFSGSTLCSPNVFSMRCWQTRGNQTGYYKAFFQYPFNWVGCNTYWITSDIPP